jgi:hypothetical protein
MLLVKLRQKVRLSGVGELSCLLINSAIPPALATLRFVLRAPACLWLRFVLRAPACLWF